MDLVLDGRGPLYLQLARALRQAIVCGRVPHGSRVPPSRELAIRTGLSRTTIVAAYRLLETEGLLIPRVGDGSYVCAPDPPSPRSASQVEPHPAQTMFARRARAAVATQPYEGEHGGAFRYSFAYNSLQLNSRLPDDWARLIAKEAPYVRTSYPPIQGSERLRAEIALHARLSRGIDCQAEDVLVVNGTRQAYSLAARVLLDAGQVAAIEDPHYFGIRRVLQAEGAEILGVPVDDHGMMVNVLDGHSVKAVFVMPSHQFPTGTILSGTRRVALVDYARRQNAWIVEDDFGGEFRHGEPATRALYSIDRGARVVYIGSFSRSLFPAMRLGYVLMPRALRQDFLAAKALSDFGVSPYEQEALGEFISSGGYSRHIRLCVSTLSDRRRRLRHALGHSRLSCMSVTGRNAGMHLVGWLDGVSEEDMRYIIDSALDKGVLVQSIASFYLASPPKQGLVLGFGCLHAAEIPAAVASLAQAVTDFRSKRRDGRAVRKPRTS